MTKVRDAKKIEFATDVLVAEAHANITVNAAVGDVQKILQTGKADAAIINAYVSAEVGAYGHVVDTLGLTGEDLVKYIWYDSLGGGGVQHNSQNNAETQILVGVNPAAYINE